MPLALDGDPATSWHTSTYKQNFGPAGLKNGVGLVLDLGAAKGVREIDIATLGGRPRCPVYVTDDRPHRHRRPHPGRDAAGNGGLVTLDEAVPGQFVTVWLTSMPAVERRVPRRIAEVAVKGWMTERRERSDAELLAGTSRATPTPSASSSPGTATGCGRSPCARWATPRTPPTASRRG